MPEVDEPPKIEELFARARKAAAEDIFPGKGKNRNVVVVTPGRLLMMHPCPAPGSMKDEHVQEIEKTMSSKNPRNSAFSRKGKYLTQRELHIVTGAFGYSGKYIATRLLKERHRVRTLTNSTNRANAFVNLVEVCPFNFDDEDKLVETLRGATVFYNTYWVRFNHPRFKFADAVKNTLKLFDAAKKAGVQRFVHVSITNPSEDSDLEYFRGKATLERALVESGLSYAILRPAVLFGKEDVLVNNLAWSFRRWKVSLAADLCGRSCQTRVRARQGARK